ncbi:MAG: Icc-related predicted phosphoesterase [Paraglaciecola sp.]|jgi:Icc-related predicted phosphoesterase
MKITFISDTHGKHGELTTAIPKDTELLIHAGDLSSMGKPEELSKFLNWYNDLPIPNKIFIAGNHDFLPEESPSLFRSILDNFPNLIYLENEEVVIENIKIWGSPITPFFFNWAFNRQRGPKIRRYWEAIPEDVDILVTHGPPLNFGDRTTQGELVGCKDLLDIVEKIKPKYHTFGHIHEGYGRYENDATTFINASVVDARYEMVNAPVSINFEKI